MKLGESGEYEDNNACYVAPGGTEPTRQAVVQIVLYLGFGLALRLGMGLELRLRLRLGLSIDSELGLGLGLPASHR